MSNIIDYYRKLVSEPKKQNKSNRSRSKRRLRRPSKKRSKSSKAKRSSRPSRQSRLRKSSRSTMHGGAWKTFRAPFCYKDRDRENPQGKEESTCHSLAACVYRDRKDSNTWKNLPVEAKYIRASRKANPIVQKRKSDPYCKNEPLGKRLAHCLFESKHERNCPGAEWTGLVPKQRSKSSKSSLRKKYVKRGNSKSFYSIWKAAPKEIIKEMK